MRWSTRRALPRGWAHGQRTPPRPCAFDARHTPHTPPKSRRPRLLVHHEQTFYERTVCTGRLPGKRRAKPRNGTRRGQGLATSLTIPASSYGNALGSDSARDPGFVSISARFSLFRDRRKPRCSPRSQRGRTRHGRGYISREPPFGRVRVSVGWWHRVIPTRPAAE